MQERDMDKHKYYRDSNIRFTITEYDCLALGLEASQAVLTEVFLITVPASMSAFLAAGFVSFRH